MGEPQCPTCGGARVPGGTYYMGTLAVCRCPFTMNGITYYTIETPLSQLDRIEQKLNELLRILRSDNP